MKLQLWERALLLGLVVHAAPSQQEQLLLDLAALCSPSLSLEAWLHIVETHLCWGTCPVCQRA